MNLKSDVIFVTESRSARRPIKDLNSKDADAMMAGTGRKSLRRFFVPFFKELVEPFAFRNFTQFLKQNRWGLGIGFTILCLGGFAYYRTTTRWQRSLDHLEFGISPDYALMPSQSFDIKKTPCRLGGAIDPSGDLVPILYYDQNQPHFAVWSLKARRALISGKYAFKKDGGACTEHFPLPPQFLHNPQRHEIYISIDSLGGAF